MDEKLENTELNSEKQSFVTVMKQGKTENETALTLVLEIKGEISSYNARLAETNDTAYLSRNLENYKTYLSTLSDEEKTRLGFITTLLKLIDQLNDLLSQPNDELKPVILARIRELKMMNLKLLAQIETILTEISALI